MKRKRKDGFITTKEIVDDMRKQEAAKKKFNDINNEIKWLEPTEQAYDESKLNHIFLDGYRTGWD
jgi:hypothetical protein